jgi:ferredoxin--NADP+ reductase
VGGSTRFACVDGPEFDGHEVDWELLMAQQRIYLEEEKLAMAEWHQGCQARN